MQSVSPRIWTRIAVFISYGDNDYTTDTSVRDDERCGMSKEVNTPELIRQRIRVSVSMLRF